MGGLRNLCKMYGKMKINGVTWLWDHAKDEPVKEEDMPQGSLRRAASDKARAEYLRANFQTDADNRESP